MNLRITKRQLTLCGLSIITVLLTLLVQTAQATVLPGTSRTVTRDLVVNGTAEASVSITPRDDILAGNYLAGWNNQIVLATWSASVTGGTLATRLNPTVVDTSQPYLGYLKRSGAPTNTLRVQLSFLNSISTCTTGELNTGTWLVCAEGYQKAGGYIKTYGAQTIVGGSYPIAIDAVAWMY
ncbi:TPA: hypothetical protein ACS70L_003376 [Providencia alcalifaciens]